MGDRVVLAVRLSGHGAEKYWYTCSGAVATDPEWKSSAVPHWHGGAADVAVAGDGDVLAAGIDREALLWGRFISTGAKYVLRVVFRDGVADPRPPTLRSVALVGRPGSRKLAITLTRPAQVDGRLVHLFGTRATGLRIPTRNLPAGQQPAPRQRLDAPALQDPAEALRRGHRLPQHPEGDRAAAALTHGRSTSARGNSMTSLKWITETRSSRPTSRA